MLDVSVAAIDPVSIAIFYVPIRFVAIILKKLAQFNHFTFQFNRGLCAIISLFCSILFITTMHSYVRLKMCSTYPFHNALL